MTTLSEADVEDAVLEWLGDLGWQTAHGPDIGPGASGEERADYGAVAVEWLAALGWQTAGRRGGVCLTAGATLGGRADHGLA